MTHHTAKKSSRLGFIRETIGELKKVTWLSKPEIAYLTFLVLIIALVTGLILGAVDYSFTRLVNEVFLGR